MTAVIGGVGCGGNVRFNNNSLNLLNFHNPSTTPSCSLMVSSKPRTSMIKATATTSSKLGLRALPKQTSKKQHKASSYERIDEWMRDSVADIVKKLPESPLLIHVYSDKDDNTTETKVGEEKWVSMKLKWKKGESPIPDGVIFVEHVEQQDEENAWGIVVQGQGEAPACYLLKTSKVSSGLGLRCTHFCLVKVTSFRETALSQLKNSWLLQAN